MNENITGSFDARCPKCNKKIGWHGGFNDRPPCPKCGHIVGAKRIQEKIDNLFICTLVQALYYEHKHQLAPTELTFIRNMLQQSKRLKPYTQIQAHNIQRIATIYGVKEKPKEEKIQ
jgi:hypothetical protein